MILKKPGRRVTLSIPDHRTLKIGLLRRLIRDAELTPEQFFNLLK